MKRTAGEIEFPGGTGAQPIQRERERCGLIRRFYLSMLVIAAIDVCFAVIYQVPLDRFLPTACLLVLTTLLGAHFLSRPLRRFLRAPEKTLLPVRTIASLTYICTAFVAVMIGVLAVVKFVLLPDLLGFDIELLLTRNERLWLPIIHTLYYTALIYFVIADYEVELRLKIFEWYGRSIPAPPGRFLYRLLIAFTVTSVLPIGLIVLHALEHDMATEHRLLFQDIAASALAFAVTLFFVTRSLLRPIQALESATNAVQRNDLSVNVPVLGDDETGRLAKGFNRMVKGLRERALIRETFGRYLPEGVAAAILSNAGDLKPRSAIATILYVDIAEFTSVAERATPDQVVEMLNEYFSAVVAPIEENNGVVTQFQGDALLATFNVPITDVNHASSGLRAALAIQRICSERDFAGTTLKARIGIATGQVTAGNVGSDSRLSYTVHGDAVNVAARLEQLNKQLGTHLLLDGETAKRLDDKMAVTFVNEFTLRGRGASVRVCTVAPSEQQQTSL